MRFLADECCDAPLVDPLRKDGHDVLYAMEELRGEPDDEVLRRAYGERRLVLTEDKDFGELVFRFNRPTHGIILLRFDSRDRALKVQRMRQLLAQEEARLPGASVVLETKVRIRPFI